MQVAGSQPPLAGRREWLGLAVLALPTMLTMVDIGVLFLALPHLTADLGAGATEQLWISDIYGFLIAGFLVTMGTLGDKVGRRRVLLVGAAAFGLISILAAYSSSTEMLLISRALLGIAGATIMPSTLSLIMVMFPNPKQMGAAIGVWAAALTAGVALGPVVGGLLLNWFWWGSVFLIAVPVMAVVVIFGPKLLPDFKNPAPGKLDLLSVVLLLATLLPFIYGLKEIARSGWEATPVIVGVVGLLFGVLFVVRQSKLEHPLLDLSLFGIRTVSGALVLGLLIAAVQGGVGFFLAQHLQLVKGLSPLGAGLWILLPTGVLVIGIFVSQRLALKIPPARIIATGTIIAAIGMVWLTQITAATGLAVLLIGFTILYLGVSPVGPLVGQLVVPSAPPEKMGSASGLQSTSGELGVALGIALLGSVGTAVYRGELTVPAEIAGTPAGVTAGETLAGALHVAPTLPSGTATALIDAARSAFTSGLNVAALIGAIAFVGLAVLALVTLGHVKPMGAAAAPPDEAPADPGEQASAA